MINLTLVKSRLNLFRLACLATVLIATTSHANGELHVGSRIHFNTNVSNFVEARAFYGMLGFDTVTGFPDTNTQAMAAAIGITPPTSYDGSQGDEVGGYLLHGELISPDGISGGLIDLIEFTIPRNEASPYARLNRLGMSRAAMLTTDLDGDYARLVKAGVKFLSEPVTSSDGTRFAIFTDLDGTFYELQAIEGEIDEGAVSQIKKLGEVHINVSDLQRSIDWYNMLGYEVVRKLSPTEPENVAAALGFAEPIKIDGVLMQSESDESLLKLVQWLQPYDATPPYPVPINHFGIQRMAFTSSDIEADVATLKAQGVEFISPITPCCSGPDSWGTIVAFYDPDGTIMELTEQPGTAVMEWFMWLQRKLF